MATFDRMDICHAHRALENDWNKGGWLQDRPSNARRHEATHVQLARIGFSPRRDDGCSWEYLRNANQREIYCNALVSYGLVRYLSEDDETHGGIIRYMQRRMPGALPTLRIVPRVHPKHGALLFLNDTPANAGCVSCYAHAGQHSEADISYYHETRPDHEGQCADLLREYRDLGGRYAAAMLVIRRRLDYDMLRKQWA